MKWRQCPALICCAAHVLKADAGLLHLASFLLHLLAFVAAQAGKVGGEVGVAGVAPVQLHAAPEHQAVSLHFGRLARRLEEQVQRGDAGFASQFQGGVEQGGAGVGAGGEQPGAGDRGEGDGAEQFGVVAQAARS
jgi:hypothetical protein